MSLEGWKGASRIVSRYSYRLVCEDFSAPRHLQYVYVCTGANNFM